MNPPSFLVLALGHENEDLRCYRHLGEQRTEIGFMQNRLASAAFAYFAAAFIVSAGGHGVGFLWMMFYRPLAFPFITLLAAVSGLVIFTSPLWRSPLKSLRVGLLLLLVTIVIVLALSEAKLRTLATSLPSIGLAVWGMRKWAGDKPY